MASLPFLEKAFLLSWADAVDSHNALCDGLADQHEKRRFVLFLQNTLEIGFKRFLINKGDLSFAHEKIRGTLEKALGGGASMNQALINLGHEFRSASFSELIKNETLLNAIAAANPSLEASAIKNSLRRLNQKRNALSHFDVCSDYLSFDEWLTFDDLFLSCFRFFKKSGFYPALPGWGESGPSFVADRFCPIGRPESVRSFRDLLLIGRAPKELAEAIKEECEDGRLVLEPCDDPFSFACRAKGRLKLGWSEEMIYRWLSFLEEMGVLSIDLKEDSSELSFLKYF